MEDLRMRRDSEFNFFRNTKEKKSLKEVQRGCQNALIAEQAVPTSLSLVPIV